MTERYEGEERRASPPWHLDRTVNLGHLLTTITVVTGLFVWGAKMDTRVSILESVSVAQMRTNEAHEATDRELRLSIKEGLEGINAKLDKIIISRMR